jgi:hypothetical protein
VAHQGKGFQPVYDQFNLVDLSPRGGWVIYRDVLSSF